MAVSQYCAFLGRRDGTGIVGITNTGIDAPVTGYPDVVVAFAFSLTSDGAPGSYNNALAAHLQSRFATYRSTGRDLPQVTLQWEIADALAELDSKWMQELTASSKLTVAQPPEFAAGQIDDTLLERWLAQVDSGIGLESEHRQTLRRCIENVQGNSVTDRLNRLLTEPKLYEHFDGLELVNLTRPELGDLFTEYRSLPNPQAYPSGLRQFQCKRVNRLIIEKVVDDPKLIQRGRYLSTTGVVGCALDNHFFRTTDRKTLGVIAHPLHAPRCIEQTKQAVSKRKFDVHISGEGVETEIPWDASTAQVWCQTASNWNAYENIVRKLLEKPV